jgi:phosphatidylglycerophosphatase A
MNAKTDAPPPGVPPSAMLYKPRFALFIATVCGLGYIPIAPGTFGSLVGVVLYRATAPLIIRSAEDIWVNLGVTSFGVIHVSLIAIAVCFLLAVAGVWASNRVEKFSPTKDPQYVVIDEVSGQFLTYLLALAPLNWKYLLVGFILFRVFDIWKPFPARQAERLPGGWGIMADDWVAGIYAALGLWIARAAGL